jgi:hypothetical protein
LITALNAKPRRSDSDSHRTQSHPTSKYLQITLKKTDYPNVKHWERRKNDAVQFTVIKVYDTDAGESDSESDDTGGIKKHESGVLAFLEDENGKVIDHRERKRLYAELRGFWNDNIDANHPPDNWSSAGATLRDKFRDILEGKFPFLRLCAGRWKVEALWKKNYHSWKRSLLARQARKTLLDPGSNDGSKGKQKESSDILLDSDAPRPKKAKAVMGPIPTTTQTRKVCQSIADSDTHFCSFHDATMPVATTSDCALVLDST